ncbi:uncharacterized protein LOC125028282 [Penaeus chinensis]|uniref:uncharacterized protein LOC125028282 n=1 Tax=Penaeus chinensis TaxID=139456 RepID=UPI001FB80F6E|nr:uncharacterized protein LOC125028282 [Penaeus chinensis]
MNTHILVLLTAKLVTSTSTCNEWASTTHNRSVEVNSTWENIYIFFISEKQNTRFQITFSKPMESFDLSLHEAYVYYIGRVYHQGTVTGDCESYSPVCKTYFHFGDADHLIGRSGSSSFLISSQSLVYYLTCRSLGYFPEAPVLRQNFSLPDVKPTEPQRNLSLPGVKPTEPEQNLPGVGPNQPKDQNRCTALTIGLGVVGTALLLVLAFVCVAGWRTRRAAASAKDEAASGNSTVSCHDSENSTYGTMEMTPTNT